MTARELLFKAVDRDFFDIEKGVKYGVDLELIVRGFFFDNKPKKDEDFYLFCWAILELKFPDEYEIKKPSILFKPSCDEQDK